MGLDSPISHRIFVQILRGQADAPEEIAETRLVAQGVGLRVCAEVNEAVGALLVRGLVAVPGIEPGFPD
jgi:hypothetical protein